MVLNQASVLVPVEGVWQVCELSTDTPGWSEFVILTFSGSGGTITDEEFDDATCTGISQGILTGTFSLTNDGSATVSWDGSGNPNSPTISNTPLVTTSTLTFNVPGFPAFTDKIVLLMDDTVTPNRIYSKDADDGGPLDGNLYPADISSLEPLLKQ